MRRQRSAPMRARLEGIGYAHGTFGEILQGALPGDENHFLVTLPIHRFSEARFTCGPEDTDLLVIPERKHKALSLARLLLRRLELPEAGLLEIQSDLPEGKGMASSSADLVATARAIFASTGRLTEEETLLSLLRELEPTDGVMYPEFVSFFHRQVKLHRRLGVPRRRMHILAIDEGGIIDTVEYNKNQVAYSDQECETYESLLDRTRSAFAHSDLEALGAISTRSAEMNQKRNPKRHLERLRSLGEDYDALGLVVTHSGPCAGLLFEDSRAAEKTMNKASKDLESEGYTVLRLSTLDPAQAPTEGAPPSIHGIA